MTGLFGTFLLSAHPPDLGVTKQSDSVFSLSILDIAVFIDHVDFHDVDMNVIGEIPYHTSTELRWGFSIDEDSVAEAIRIAARTEKPTNSLKRTKRGKTPKGKPTIRFLSC